MKRNIVARTVGAVFVNNCAEYLTLSVLEDSWIFIVRGEGGEEEGDRRQTCQTRHDEEEPETMVACQHSV